MGQTNPGKQKEPNQAVVCANNSHCWFLWLLFLPFFNLSPRLYLPVHHNWQSKTAPLVCAQLVKEQQDNLIFIQHGLEFNISIIQGWLLNWFQRKRRCCIDYILYPFLHKHRYYHQTQRSPACKINRADRNQSAGKGHMESFIAGEYHSRDGKRFPFSPEAPLLRISGKSYHHSQWDTSFKNLCNQKSHLKHTPHVTMLTEPVTTVWFQCRLYSNATWRFFLCVG